MIFSETEVVLLPNPKQPVTVLLQPHDNEDLVQSGGWYAWRRYFSTSYILLWKLMAIYRFISMFIHIFIYIYIYFLIV